MARSTLTAVADAFRSAFNKVDVPIPFGDRWSAGLFGGDSRVSHASQLEATKAIGTLFAIVNRLSNATSQVNWRLYRKRVDGRRVFGPMEDNRVEVTRHLALDVWNKPNNFYTRAKFVEAQQQHNELTGEAWWVVAKNQFGWPEELWPVRPDRMEPIPHSQEFLAGYIYHGPQGEQVPLATDEVISIMTPDPSNPYRGLGPIRPLSVDLDSTRFAAEWNRNFFLNGAEPGGIIESPKTLTDKDFNKFIMRWREQHQGVRNAHRVALLEEMTWKDRSLSPRDMQFVQLRGVSRELIREAYGMPKFALGDVDDVNRATAEASAFWFAEYLTTPRLERMKGVLNEEFLPMFGATGEGVEFDYDSPVPADKEFEVSKLTQQASAYKTLIESGVHPDAAAERVGWEPMEMAAVAATVASGSGSDTIEPSGDGEE